MEKHNTHLLLESLSSGRHEYKGDENGNIKVDSSDDAIYHSFFQKKAKSSIRQLLIDNNNLLKEEFDGKNEYPEVPPKKRNTIIEKRRSAKIRKNIKKSKTEDEKVKKEKSSYKNTKKEKNNGDHLITINKKADGKKKSFRPLKWSE